MNTNVSLAQMDLSRRRPGTYLVPTYFNLHNFVSERDSSHLDYAGYIINGETTAIATMWADEWAKRAMSPTDLESDWIGCRMISWSVTSPSTIDVKFNVPLKSKGHRLEIDTTSLPRFPRYGFQFIDNGKEVELVRDPELIGADTVRLSLAKAYDGGTAVVRLGFSNMTPNHKSQTVMPGTNIRTTWGKLSQWIPNVTLRHWCALDELQEGRQLVFNTSTAPAVGAE